MDVILSVSVDCPFPYRSGDVKILDNFIQSDDRSLYDTIQIYWAPQSKCDERLLGPYDDCSRGFITPPEPEQQAF